MLYVIIFRKTIKKFDIKTNVNLVVNKIKYNYYIYIYICLGKNTQNNNESFNGVLWLFAPKHIVSGAKIISIAVFLTICMFNDGCISLLKIMNILGIRIGHI